MQNGDEALFSISTPSRGSMLITLKCIVYFDLILQIYTF